MKRQPVSYAEVMSHRQEIDRPLAVPDGQIASMACVHGCVVATRNVRDFEDCGLEIVNPFLLDLSRIEFR